MQFPRRSISSWLGFFFLLEFIFKITVAFALDAPGPVHYSGRKQIWNRKQHQIELYGDAAVTQMGETIRADYIRLDLSSRILDAQGHCVYSAADSTIWGEEMHFSLNTRTGIVKGARISNERFTLRGEEIHKLGPRRFQTRWGEYTTCHDCAASWSVRAENIDLEIEGYGYLSNVTTRLKGVPGFWLPYLVIPVKTQRQSGLIFPTFSFSDSNQGAALVLPFFWAINRSADMTFGLGTYTRRGLRLEWEGRYAFSTTNTGKVNLYYLLDRQFPELRHRWSATFTQAYLLPWNIQERMRIAEVSDNLYPFFFRADMPLNTLNEAFIPSYLNFSKRSVDYLGYLSFRRYRNLLNSKPTLYDQKVSFDPRTVQVLPRLEFTLNDHSIMNSPVYVGVTGDVTNFSRSAGTFDYDSASVPFGTEPATPIPFTPGRDPIRKAVRLSLVPSLYTTLRPFKFFSIVPSLKYYLYHYQFGDLGPDISKSLDRGYLLFQADLTTQIERVFEFPSTPQTPRAKHLIRPLLTYSWIPYRKEPNHPFVQQIQYAQKQGISGYNFDNNDIVPYGFTQTGANYFVPQGNSLSYGFTTQWVRRNGPIESDKATYSTLFEVSAGQAINFLEITDPVDPANKHIFSRFFSVIGFNVGRLSSSTNYFYYPEYPATTPRHTVSTNMAYVFDRAYHQKFMLFDRSVNLGYSFGRIGTPTNALTGGLRFSLTDTILPSLNLSYGFDRKQLLGGSVGLLLQSASQCWRFALGTTYQPGGAGIQWTFDLALNLSGTGFGGVSNLVNPTAPPTAAATQ